MRKHTFAAQMRTGLVEAVVAWPGLVSLAYVMHSVNRASNECSENLNERDFHPIPHQCVQCEATVNAHGAINRRGFLSPFRGMHSGNP